MDVFLALVAKISSEYAFPAFALTLLMLPTYWLLTNPKFLGIVDRLLNKRLEQTNLYKFIRLLVILVFAFSVLVVLCSFATAPLMRMFDNRSLEILVQAKHEFEQKHYDAARGMYKKYIDLNPDVADVDEIRGMVTATYYGQGLHEQGLDFICEQYRAKPPADHSFLFAVHAHLRAISVRDGALAAEQRAQKLRTRCKRDDYSEFWAHIPFGMMESLRTATLRSEHGWTLTDEARARVAALLLQKQQTALNRYVPNGDYALYFIDRFDDVIGWQPRSRIRDVALLDAAKLGAEGRALAYLRVFVRDHRDSRRFEDGLLKLISLLADANLRDEAMTYAALFHKRDAESRLARAALEPTLAAISNLETGGDFDAAHKVTENVCAKAATLGTSCFQEIAVERARLAKAVAAIGTDGGGGCIAIHRKLRRLERDEERQLSRPWVSGTRARLINCLPALRERSPEQYPLALYLIASASRRLNDYATSFEYLQRFDNEISDSDLKDDIVTEMGYHKLVIDGDWEAARPLFERVIADYPERNAYDNSLWWLAKGLSYEGDYAGALKAYAAIGSAEIVSRFREWSDEEADRLQRLAVFPPLRGVALQSVRRPELTGIFVTRVDDSAPAASILRRGDRLVKACDKSVYAIGEVLTVLASLDSRQSCRILFLRGKQLLDISGSEGDGWQARTSHLTQDQLTELVFGL